MIKKVICLALVFLLASSFMGCALFVDKEAVINDLVSYITRCPFYESYESKNELRYVKIEFNGNQAISTQEYFSIRSNKIAGESVTTHVWDMEFSVKAENKVVIKLSYKSDEGRVFKEEIIATGTPVSTGQLIWSLSGDFNMYGIDDGEFSTTKYSQNSVSKYR